MMMIMEVIGWNRMDKLVLKQWDPRRLKALITFLFFHGLPLLPSLSLKMTQQ